MFGAERPVIGDLVFDTGSNDDDDANMDNTEELDEAGGAEETKAVIEDEGAFPVSVFSGCLLSIPQVLTLERLAKGPGSLGNHQK